MKKYNKILLLLLLVSGMFSCEDIFNTDTDNILNTEDYISKDDEMYKGFLGILTKMQQAGDHAIFLTDTRGDFLQVTGNAPLALKQIYNYEPTDGNPYADPSCYYAIVIACNDYIAKMSHYREKMGGEMEEITSQNFDKLISSTLRIKVWAYLTIGRIYGKAVWFDDALVELKDLKDTKTFTLCDMNAIVQKGLNLLDNGINLSDDKNIPATLEMEWGKWINAENPTNNYDHWNYLVPPWLLLKCDLLSWRGSESDFLWIRDNILNFLFTVHNDYTKTNAGWYYACNIPLMTGGDNIYNCEYHKMFYNELYNASNKTNLFQVITGIMYDYDNDQTNRIVEYFCNQSSGKYFLRPSTFAISKYAETDTRGFVQRKTMNVVAGDTCFTKYYYNDGKYLRTNIVEIQPVIPVYRGHDFHFLLAEAENHLGNWMQSEAILNMGVTNKFANKKLPLDWNQKYYSWFGDNGGYGDVGIVGCVRGNIHKLPMPGSPGYNITENERRKLYDLAILDEALLEYNGEGKSYSMMVKMAERYKDASIVADRVCPKYESGLRDAVRNSIMNKGYWIDWDLKLDN